MTRQGSDNWYPKDPGTCHRGTGGVRRLGTAPCGGKAMPVVVVNPRQVTLPGPRESWKTDTLDAAVLAHFGEAVRPPVRPLRDSEAQLLHSLVARRHQLVTMLVSEKNRLSAATTVAVRPSIESHIEWLERELNDLDSDLRQTIRRSPVWREKDDPCAFPESESRSPSPFCPA